MLRNGRPVILKRKGTTPGANDMDNYNWLDLMKQLSTWLHNPRPLPPWTSPAVQASSIPLPPENDENSSYDNTWDVMIKNPLMAKINSAQSVGHIVPQNVVDLGNQVRSLDSNVHDSYDKIVALGKWMEDRGLLTGE